ncbi:uncharacterized protein YdeI (YjbR/CyaY-like superfamily) [Mesonia algae]|uniref:Uncharacterized protein YdeI (YjbR/CyaY-like superfamily) n=1 Tax=Mesonia algae TaxID=213248 RepID=A0A2W7I2T7_9FLAO|nr:DUF1801 domain-containing protein [Mesonia algae]PZW39762.1 uncharacterized protein YdeI (YjbR/CyaY-like superfamily) [Mesonia algae]
MPVKNFEDYIEKHPQWENELRQLREVILLTNLEETIKWGAPTYTLKNKNVVSLGGFKNHYALWFFNGALLKKNTNLLVNAQKGKTKALRQIKFTKEDAIDSPILRAYIEEAIQLQQEGKSIPIQKNKELIIPMELTQFFQKNPEMETSFLNLTKGKQREYADYIREAKRSSTKDKRLEKIKPMIINQVGLYDKYK